MKDADEESTSLVRTPSDVVGRVAVLLRAVAANEPDGATTSSLASSAGVARATAHRLLTSLADRGMTERLRSNGRWVLGPELYLWGTAARRRYDLTALALPVVRRLAVETEESAFFSIRRGDETVCMVREDGSFPLRSHVLYEGVRFPLGVASAGLAILAFLPDPEIDDFFRRCRIQTFGPTHSEAAVRERLAETKQRGWAINPGLIVEGSWGMGASVFDASGAPVGALSLTGVEHRFAESRRPELGRRLLQAAHELTSRMRQSAPDWQLR